MASKAIRTFPSTVSLPMRADLALKFGQIRYVLRERIDRRLENPVARIGNKIELIGRRFIKFSICSVACYRHHTWLQIPVVSNATNEFVSHVSC